MSGDVVAATDPQRRNGHLRRRAMACSLLAIIVASTVAISRVSPPGQLSLLDAAMGGGLGVEKTEDGIAFGTHRQRLDIWRPAASGGRTLPVLIFWYGGGWVKGVREDYAFAARTYAKQGFVVVVPDYRKVPTVRFPAFLEDGAQAVRWTRDHIRDFGGDPHAITVAGHSVGAYTVAMLTLDPRWLRAEASIPASSVQQSACAGLMISSPSPRAGPSTRCGARLHHGS